MYKPENNTVRYNITDLVYLMARLRDPLTGCPWDVKQTFASIVPSTLEEVYEVVDAIEKNDNDNLREELGDLLFQVVFYGQMAAEENIFNFDDVAHGIVEKLLRRHPHVFPSGDLYDKDSSRRDIDEPTLLAQWERIKQEEKQGKQIANTEAGVLDGVPVAMPALQRSYKIQKKLAAVGFDWKSPEELFPIVESELQEARAAIASGVQDDVEDELGDVLFAVVNLARHYKVDPESALRRANRKVTQRFSYVEAQLKLQGKTPLQASMDEMELLWQQAKKK
jgi:ATP diphosphatase